MNLNNPLSLINIPEKTLMWFDEARESVIVWKRNRRFLLLRAICWLRKILQKPTCVWFVHVNRISSTKIYVTPWLTEILIDSICWLVASIFHSQRGV